MYPPVVHFRETASPARQLHLAKHVTARDFFLLLERLVSISDLMPLGHLRYWPLQLYLLAPWGASQGQLMDRIPLDHLFLDLYLKWWTKLANVLQGRPVQAPIPQLAVYREASTSCWGALCDSQSTAGLWLAAETAHHINGLELLAIQKAVRHFLPLIIGKVVMVHSDNSSAVVYVGIQGDTHSLPVGHPSGV